MIKVGIQKYSDRIIQYVDRLYVLMFGHETKLIEYDKNYMLLFETIIDSSIAYIRQFDSNQILLKGNVGCKLKLLFNIDSREATSVSDEFSIRSKIGDKYIIAYHYDKEKVFLLDNLLNVIKPIEVGGTKNNTRSVTHPKKPIEIEWYRRLDPTDFKDFFIRAYDLLTDNLIWKTGIDGRVILKIFIDNYIIFSTRSNESMPSEQTRSLYCIKVETGEIQWFKYNFHVYDLLNESSDTVIVHSHDTTYRIDVHTGSVILSKENTTDVLSSIRPFFVDDEGVLFVGRSNNMADNRFGRLSKETFDIEWMYYYEIEGNKNLFLHDMILLEDGRYLMRNGLQGHERLFIFDPDDPENIPYRGISNGEVTDYTNLN